MFFNRRVLQAEYFDSVDRPTAELAEGYALLALFNRMFLLARPFQTWLPKKLGMERCRSLSLLDLGAGDGSLGDELSRWAAGRGWEWRVTNLDLNPRAMQLNPCGKSIAGSALSLPFRDRTFDVVIASQMAHHLMSDEDVVIHFREAWRVTNDLLFFNDLHRNLALYAVLWFLLRLHECPKHFSADALLSVRRSWRVKEWRALAGRAEIPDARIWLYAGARIMLQARKSG
ncbi:MAG: methyltransferase domain protein [Pedosphaera sp.]|nr:methyltransferase domain protein [Pedosphaera sp.]